MALSVCIRESLAPHRTASVINMRCAIAVTALMLAIACGGEESNISTNQVRVKRKLSLTGARINSELTQVEWLKARFVETGGSTNPVIVDFRTELTPHVRTLTTVITACVDWATPKERDQWHGVKAEAVFDAVFLTATNSLGDLLTRPDFSQWSLISLRIDNTEKK